MADANDIGPEKSRNVRISGEDIAHGLCREFFTEEFFEKYWEKKPLHWRSSERGRAANRMPEALGVDDAMRILLRASSVKIVKNGQPHDASSCSAAYLDGASLIVNQADRCDKTLFDMCRVLAQRYFTHVFCVLYLTPPGSQAVRLHNDDQDVFLMQVWGSKKWKIRNSPKWLPYTEEMLGKDEPVPAELIGEVSMEFTMEANDVLYIPRGFLHEAATGGEHSLHLTVTAPTSDYCWGVQIVKHLLDSAQQEVSQAPLLQSWMGAGGSDTDAALDDRLQNLVREWAQELSPTKILDLFDKRMAAINERQDKQCSMTSAKPCPVMVTEQSRVRLMHGVLCHCDEQNKLAVFRRTMDNQLLELPVSATSMPLIRSLTKRPQLVTQLPCADAFERICVLQMLNKQGVVQLFTSVGPGSPEEGCN